MKRKLPTKPTPELPHPIAGYFDADKGDAQALIRCFAEDAVVKDEDRTYTGRLAIKQWKAEASKKYQYTSEPLGIDVKDGMTIVTSRLTGNFPRSPINLRYLFGLNGDEISSLEIIP